MKINREKIWKSIEPVIFGVALAFLIKTFFIQAYVIPSGSMMDTLLIGDCLLANKLAYSLKIPFTNKTLLNISSPKRHDIIIFKYPKNPKLNYIKRVIGLPNEIVQIKNNTVFIDNVPLKNDYAIFKKIPFATTSKNFGPVKIPSNHIFVLGDNRNNSSDSRTWGFVNINAIKGKAAIIYWSWDSTKRLPRLNRIFNSLHEKNTN